MATGSKRGPLFCRKIVVILPYVTYQLFLSNYSILTEVLYEPIQLHNAVCRRQ